MCKSWCEFIIAIVVIVFALWTTMYSQWILVIAGIILAIHSFSCKKCFGMHKMEMSTSSKGRKR